VSLEAPRTVPGAKIADNAIVPDDIKENIEEFAVNGFTRPIKLYEPADAAALIREIRVRNHVASNALYANSVNYDRHFDIPELARHIAHPTIIKYLSAILGPDILAWRTEWFPKFPGAKATEWHQVRDYSYANGNPQLLPTQSDWNAYTDITVWTTFTPATKETACMRFVRGSQHEAIFDEHKKTDAGRADYDVAYSDTGFFGYDFADFKIDPDWEPSGGCHRVGDAAGRGRHLHGIVRPRLDAEPHRARDPFRNRGALRPHARPRLPRPGLVQRPRRNV